MQPVDGWTVGRVDGWTVGRGGPVDRWTGGACCRVTSVTRRASYAYACPAPIARVLDSASQAIAPRVAYFAEVFGEGR